MDERQAIPVIASHAVHLLSVLDGIRHLRGAMLTIWERENPGALATVRVWAAANSIALDERTIEEYPDVTVAEMRIPGGPSVSVHTSGASE